MNGVAKAASAVVRVRYAPSPTGFLHLGGLRTALFNYLFARKNNGTFILRIEDTDKTRQVPGSITGLIRALQWCGLDYDEGPTEVPAFEFASGKYSKPQSDDMKTLHQCGHHTPYIQSHRLSLYSDAAARLLSSGHAYRCFCSGERLASLRSSQHLKGQNSAYDRACEGLGSEAERRAAMGEPHTIRLRVPSGITVLEDEVLGEVRFGHNVVDDQILMKSDGYPTYHLAAVVDDHHMQVSHVIRGQEWLSSTPKHVLLYKALGWEPPKFAHLPLLLNTDRSKLSKRMGDAAVEDFMEAGYLPEALVNFVALLGWTPPDAKEVMNLSEMVEKFDLKAINKSNAIVDRARLDFFNGEHIRLAFRTGSISKAKDGEAPLAVGDTPKLASFRESVHTELNKLLSTLGCVPAVDITSRCSTEYFNALLSLQCERVHKLQEFAALIFPFLAEEAEQDDYMTRQLVSPAAVKILGKQAPQTADPDELRRAAAKHILSLQGAYNDIIDGWAKLPVDTFTGHAGEAVQIVKSVAKLHKCSPGTLMLATRFALTGLDVGASFSDTLRFMGRDKSITRIRRLLTNLASTSAN